MGAYYAYDDVGRLVSELWCPAGDVIYHEYDALGARTRTKKTGVDDQAWQYDAAGWAIRHTQGTTHLYYEYDSAGHRTNMIQSGQNLATGYTHDARGLLQTLTDPWDNVVYYEHDALGLEIVKRLPNGVTTYHNYDAVAQVTDILHVGPSGLVQSLYYTYDDDARRTKIVREDGTSIYYNYDTAARLVGEDWLDSSSTSLYAYEYEYDAAGNRTLLTKDAITTYYAYNSLNQLTRTEDTLGARTYYEYQADGATHRKHDGGAGGRGGCPPGSPQRGRPSQGQDYRLVHCRQPWKRPRPKPGPSYARAMTRWALRSLLSIALSFDLAARA